MRDRSINQETKETSGAGFIEVAGINDNWVLDAYGYGGLKKDGSGTPALWFTFQSGPINLRLAEYDVNETFERDNNKKNTKSKITDDEAVDKAYNAQDGRLVQIIRCFLNKEEAVLTGKGFEELSKNIIALLDSKGKNKSEKIRLKVIYNKEGFLTVSTRNGRFIQLAIDPNNLVLSDWESNEIKNNKKSDTPTSEAALATANTVKKGEF